MPRRVGKKDPTIWWEDNHDRAIPAYVQRRVIVDAGDLCRSCGVRIRTGTGHIDHRTPLQDGGEHAFWNLQYLCTLCHRAKTSKENTARAKGNRIFDKAHGISKPRRPFPKTPKPKPEQPRWVHWVDELGRERATRVGSDEIPEGE